MPSAVTAGGGYFRPDREHNGGMPSLTQRLREFLGSPRGKRLTDQGRRQIAKPENQRRLRDFLTRLQHRRHR